MSMAESQFPKPAPASALPEAHPHPRAEEKLQEEKSQKVRVDVVQFTRGQLIIREGEYGDSAYVLTRGEVEVVKEHHGKKEVVIAMLGAHEIFGEMCLFAEDAHRSASVRVVSDRAEVMMISKQYFQSQLNTMPDGVRNIINVMVERLRRADARIVLLC